MVVEPELVGTHRNEDLALDEVASVVIRAGQQLDLSALTGLGEGDAPPAQVHVFLEDD